MCTLEALVVDAVDEDDADEPEPGLADEPQAARTAASATAPPPTTALRYEEFSFSILSSLPWQIC
jgi:hypothetical protein